MFYFNLFVFFSVDKDELKEELREDKAVKVSRKELNKLFAELSEFTDIYNNHLYQRNKLNALNEPQYTVLQNEKENTTQNNKTDGQVVSKQFLNSSLVYFFIFIIWILDEGATATRKYSWAVYDTRTGATNRATDETTCSVINTKLLVNISTSRVSWVIFNIQGIFGELSLRFKLAEDSFILVQN